MAIDEARTVFNVLMTTGQERIRRHYYFGLPIKSLAIFMTFVDLVVAVFPAMLVATNFRIILFALTFGIRVGALYSVLVPKVQHLNMYRGALLITVGITFAFNCMHVVTNFTSTNCQKIYIRNLFAVCGVICPIEVLVFTTISAYINFVIEEGSTPNEPQNPENGQSNLQTVVKGEKESPAKENLNTSETSETLNTSVTDPQHPLLS
ncbi:unnamed protein product [Bursaphelenchus okinawaensis]|uniref:Uncharacterized protein n=1 Tax=Bursaphelenchus okinawaensis TaxID=465554 RepID=A0A811LP46_9BILA|nr:unnamed protein product [Bursaphelenchus okinawaensis]CAG9127467.1 unnamed protein product [Bursaphelenchus okinawaensis]